MNNWFVCDDGRFVGKLSTTGGRDVKVWDARSEFVRRFP